MAPQIIFFIITLITINVSGFGITFGGKKFGLNGIEKAHPGDVGLQVGSLIDTKVRVDPNDGLKVNGNLNVANQIKSKVNVDYDDKKGFKSFGAGIETGKTIKHPPKNMITFDDIYKEIKILIGNDHPCLKPIINEMDKYIKPIIKTTQDSMPTIKYQLEETEGIMYGIDVVNDKDMNDNGILMTGAMFGAGTTDLRYGVYYGEKHKKIQIIVIVMKYKINILIDQSTTRQQKSTSPRSSPKRSVQSSQSPKSASPRQKSIQSSKQSKSAQPTKGSEIVSVLLPEKHVQRKYEPTVSHERANVHQNGKSSNSNSPRLIAKELSSNSGDRERSGLSFASGIPKQQDSSPLEQQGVKQIVYVFYVLYFC